MPHAGALRVRILEKLEEPAIRAAWAMRDRLTVRALRGRDDYEVENAFHSWRSQRLGGAPESVIDFRGSIPAGKRALVTLVSAIVDVPTGGKARLHMHTRRGFVPADLELVFTGRGRAAGGGDVLFATHAVHAHSDGVVQFGVTREDGAAEGDAFICISGFLIDR